MQLWMDINVTLHKVVETIPQQMCSVIKAKGSPTSIIRAILKKYKETGTVTNLLGTGAMFILPPCTARRMVREAK